jgi:hypothetical protein
MKFIILKTAEQNNNKSSQLVEIPISNINSSDLKDFLQDFISFYNNRKTLSDEYKTNIKRILESISNSIRFLKNKEDEDKKQSIELNSTLEQDQQNEKTLKETEEEDNRLQKILTWNETQANKDLISRQNQRKALQTNNKARAEINDRNKQRKELPKQHPDLLEEDNTQLTKAFECYNKMKSISPKFHKFIICHSLLHLINIILLLNSCRENFFQENILMSLYAQDEITIVFKNNFLPYPNKYKALLEFYCDKLAEISPDNMSIDNIKDDVLQMYYKKEKIVFVGKYPNDQYCSFITYGKLNKVPLKLSIYDPLKDNRLQQFIDASLDKLSADNSKPSLNNQLEITTLNQYLQEVDVKALNVDISLLRQFSILLFYKLKENPDLSKKDLFKKYLTIYLARDGLKNIYINRTIEELQIEELKLQIEFENVTQNKKLLMQSLNKTDNNNNTNE